MMKAMTTRCDFLLEMILGENASKTPKESCSYRSPVAQLDQDFPELPLLAYLFASLQHCASILSTMAFAVVALWDKH